MKRADKSSEKVLTEYEQLLEYMRLNVSRHSIVDNWNDVREEAKALFPNSISRMDASGYIKQFKLQPNTF